VAEAALWVAKSEYPSLDVTAYLRCLDRWGAEVRSRLPDQPTAEQIVLTLNEFLFEELGFDGDMDSYYDPRNSYLNEVMDRRLGIPITLSILYLDVGCSAGLPLEGVSFPGHFLVKFSVQQGEVVLDPFSQGVSLEEADLEELLARAEVNLHAARPSLTQLLVGADPRDILVRMLRNLKGIYLHQKNLHKTLHMMDLIVAVRPDTPFEYRDRARVYQELECFGAALADYRHYLELSPRADDAEEIRGRVIELQRRKQVLH
ncbi:MAG TPA: tetratricopeptide repeat protein, partial [Gammaproteobacteria bacterium]|nr:tetratricopeptide repeat protein [Gammaproteobacteria bacterium]